MEREREKAKKLKDSITVGQVGGEDLQSRVQSSTRAVFSSLFHYSSFPLS
jgi:hypothetical protein